MGTNAKRPTNYPLLFDTEKGNVATDSWECLEYGLSNSSDSKSRFDLTTPVAEEIKNILNKEVGVFSRCLAYYYRNLECRCSRVHDIIQGRLPTILIRPVLMRPCRAR